MRRCETNPRPGIPRDREWRVHLLGLRHPRLRPVLHALAFLKREIVRHQRIPLRPWLAQLRDGFWSENHILYDFQHNDRREYLSDYAHIARAQYLNGLDGLLLRDKLWFHWVMQPFAEYLPKLYGVLRRGVLHPLCSEEAASGRETARSIPALLEAEQDLILKPIHGAEGHGVTRLTLAADGYRLNGRPITERTLSDYIDSLDAIIVQEFIPQDAFPASIFPGVANTMRLLTMWDQETDAPFVGAACHRFGRPTSIPVDNTFCGGLSAGIDLTSGELGPAAPTQLDGPHLVWHEHHPDSGARIRGRIVPRWNAVKELACALASHLSFLSYVGWDLVLSEGPPGIRVLEANDFCGVQLLQMHRPLLRDQRVRAFYESRGVVCRR